MVDTIVRTLVAHRGRLTELMLSLKAQGTISLNLATFWATRRTGYEIAVGCPIGHYVATAKPPHLQMVPVNFLEQVKSPLLYDKLFNVLPNADWQHHTLHYVGPDIEAWGMNALCLYFQLREWDARTLFYPAGYESRMMVDSDVVRAKLVRFLNTEKALHEDLP